MGRTMAFAIALVLALPACTSDTAEFDTYTEEDGSVWIVSDCPGTDQLLNGEPDGLPAVDGIQTREEIESWLGSGSSSRIIPRNGQAWERNADGTVYTVAVKDFMIEVTVDSPSDCPGVPTMNNGVPVIFRIEGG